MTGWIMAIGFLVLGVAGLAAGVLLRKKLSRVWMASFCVAGVLLAVLGGALGVGQWNQTREERTWSYLALCYLEQGQTEQAAQYLLKTDRQDLETTAAQLLLERLRGNDTIARLRADTLNNLARTDSEKNLCSMVSGVAAGDYEAVRTAAGLLREQSALTGAARTQADRRFAAETGVWLGDPEDPTAYDQELPEAERLRQQVDQALNNGSNRWAVESAAQLVQLAPSADNRLLLASAVAESVYSGDYLDASCFAADGQEPDESATAEREKLAGQIEKLESQQAQLDLALEGASDEAESERLADEKAQLFARQEELQAESDNLYARRALSSIAGIHSLEAEIVRARLQYAMRDYERAVDQLLSAAGSLQCRLSPSGSLTNGLNAVRRAYEGGSDAVGVESDQFRDTMVALLSSGSDSVALASGSLTQSFADRIVSDQKVYGKDLYASGIDLSEFPQVTLLLSGRAEAMQQLVDGQGQVKDTRAEVDWQAEMLDAEGVTNQLCCVVDCSGSMGGEPMANLQEALIRFAQSDLNGAYTSLVTFEDTGRVASELSADPTRLQAAARELVANGGTNISAGLEQALAVLGRADGARTVLLMTDGQSSLDMGVVQQLAAQGIVVHTIGFGQVDDNLLQTIADATGGQYIRADSSSELENVYASLVGLIGNRVQLRYTAADTDTAEGRYVYVTTGEGSASVRVEYSLQDEGSDGRGLRELDPDFVTTDDMAARLAEDGSLTMTLWLEPVLGAEHLTGVQLGGQDVNFIARENDAYTVDLTLPAAPAAGGHTLTLTWDDGLVQEYPDALLVGARLNTGSFRLGRLRLSATALLTGDGRLALRDPWLTEEVAEGQESAFSLSVQGNLTLPVDEAAILAADAAGGTMDLGQSDVLTGYGMLNLNSGDKAYTWNAPALTGGTPQNFQVEATAEYVRFLTGAEEGGETDGTVPQE